MRVDIDEIIESVHKNPWTAIVVDINGVVKDCIPLEQKNSPMTELSEKHEAKISKGCAVSYLDQNKNITEADIQRKIQESVKALKYAKAHNLKSGINIPKKEKL